jgi:hypothetical protein
MHINVWNTNKVLQICLNFKIWFANFSYVVDGPHQKSLKCSSSMAEKSTILVGNRFCHPNSLVLLHPLFLTEFLSAFFTLCSRFCVCKVVTMTKIKTACLRNPVSGCTWQCLDVTSTHEITTWHSDPHASFTEHSDQCDNILQWHFLPWHFTTSTLHPLFDAFR